VKIDYHPDFVKSFSRRIKPHKSLIERFNRRFLEFRSNRSNPILRDHSLKGSKLGLRAFSINGDIRVIYSIEEDGRIIFVDIGSHNQVY